jgi:EpsD family peptidyl-prolyl cis-trans isomerase
MTTSSEALFPAPHRLSSLPLLAVALGLSAVLLVGCGKNKDKAATQSAAKVNKEEITIHQINALLERRPPPPEQAASASRQALEQLIDQELEIQQAEDQKLDRQPRVVQQIEATRREIIARAYIEKISNGAPKPTPAEIADYYQAHPELFKNRRVYNLQEVNIEATPEQVATLKNALPAAKTFADFVAFLKTNGLKYKVAEAVRAAEQLPLASVKQFAEIKDGQAVFSERPGGVQIVYVVQSKIMPVNEQQAAAVIERFLLNQRKVKLVADDLQTLRGAAKIEYLGEFAKDAAQNPYRPASSPELPPLTSIAPPAPASSIAAMPQVDVAPREVSAASMPSDATLDKGLKGLK